jgi:hypothetical protein
MKLLLSLIITASLFACAAPTPVSYYQLTVPPAVSVPEQNTESTLSLVLQPVKVANYLNGAGLVMQRSEVELVIASRHLWADALDQQLYRLLVEQLQARLPEMPLASGRSINSVQLQLTIDRFHAKDNGMAIVSGHYTISSATERLTESFSYQQALAADGYAALVTALSVSWQQLMTDMISRIEQHDLRSLP